MPRVKKTARKRRPAGPTQRRKSSDADVSVRNLSVASKKTRRWKLPAKLTMNAFDEYLDANVENTLRTVSPDLYQEVEDVLQQVKQQVKSSISKLKLPPSKMKNYMLTQQLVRMISDTVEEQQDKIEKVDREQERVDKMEDQLEDEREALRGRLGDVTLPEVSEDSLEETKQLLVEKIQYVITSMMEGGCA